MNGTCPCPLCGGKIARIENDPWNHAQCSGPGCWMRVNPMPMEVADQIAKADEARAMALAWAADNGFWFGIAVGFGCFAVPALVVWLWR